MRGHETAESNRPLVCVRALSRRFGRKTVIDSLDLDVAAGERLALSGPNGSGKSTLLRCLAGTLTATAGTSLIGGHAAGSLEARSLVGVSLSQERSFDMRLSGRDNLLFFARLRLPRAKEAAQAVASVVEELELGAIATASVATYSTGMTQQLAFARALLGKPRVLLLDEPTRSLDEQAGRRFWAALERRPDAAVVLATHLEDDIARCGKRLELALPSP